MSIKKEMSLQKYPFNSVNPFITTVIEQIEDSKTRKVAGWKWQDVVNHDSGEVESQPMLVLGTLKQVDKQEFYKVYHDSIKEFFGLSKSSLEVFDYVMKNIKYDSDKICLVITDIQAECSLSYSSVYRALTQLLECKIIAKADMTGCYYINPNLAFKGDRITLVKQYIKNENGKLKPLKAIARK